MLSSALNTHNYVIIAIEWIWIDASQRILSEQEAYGHQFIIRHSSAGNALLHFNSRLEALNTLLSICKPSKRNSKIGSNYVKPLVVIFSKRVFTAFASYFHIRF